MTKGAPSELASSGCLAEPLSEVVPLGEGAAGTVLRARDASGAWQDVSTDADFGIAADRFNEVRFEEVTTSALRLEVELRDDSSGGVLEWRIGAE